MFKAIFRKKESSAVPVVKERTLCDVCNGQSVRIECLRGEVADCQRLREMGFCESAKIQKIAESGALICKVCDSKVVISEAMAKNIVVTLCAKEREGHEQGE